MGQLSRNLKRGRRLVAAWLLPAGFSLVLLFGVRALARADAPPSTDELAAYLQHNQLNLGVDSQGGYQQIYYMYQGHKVYLTGASYSHTNPVSSGEYVAWEGLTNGSSQIFVYDVLTHVLTQLTSTGTNQNPAIYANIVMWEGWTGQHWAVFYYDGVNVYQLTTGDTSAIRPRSDGKSIIFAEQDTSGWKTYRYELPTGQYYIVNSGNERTAAFPAYNTKDQVTGDASSFYRQY